MIKARRFLDPILRTQNFQSSGSETELNRCLSTLDITFLGIGSTLGLGIYVIAGQVASTKAGPAVIISFAIAAVASVFAGLCYAEFGARVPKAGSAYVYSYVTVGELMAFIIGWNLILEYVIGVASVARGYSGYIDSLTPNETIKNALVSVAPIDLPNISRFPDFLAFGIIMLLTVTLCFGVQFSSKFNSVFTLINLGIVVFAVVGGAMNADVNNWHLPPNVQPNNTQETEGKTSNVDSGDLGGFMPFGISGVMAGASTCFYAFIGFDVIATTGEETKNPQRSIPIGIVLSLFVVFLAYFSVSVVQTLMQPYYEQNNPAPLANVFENVGWPAAKMAVSIGALAGLSTSLLCSMFPLPRILYAMASDGLVFKWLAKVNQRFQTPILATVLSGLFAGVMAMMFDVAELADMMSIGTFLAYSLVAVSVVLLRYKMVSSLESPPCVPETLPENGFLTPSTDTGGTSQISLIDKNSNGTNKLSDQLDIPRSNVTWSHIFLQLINKDQLTQPSHLSTEISVFLVLFISVLIIVFDCLLVFVAVPLGKGELVAVVPTGIVGCLWILCMFALWRQPPSPAKLAFKVPLVPFLPFFSVAVNIYLMLQLPKLTWMRFAVWMAIGFTIYFSYGIWHSKLRYTAKETAPIPAVTLQEQNPSPNIEKVSKNSEKQGIENSGLALSTESLSI